MNVETEDGWTALMDAAIEGNAETLEYLIDVGGEEGPHRDC